MGADRYYPLVVFLHRIVMGASGTLAMCDSHRRPFLLSAPFETVVEDRGLLLENTPEALRNKLLALFADPALVRQALACVEKLREKCFWAAVGNGLTGCTRRLKTGKTIPIERA
jgi:hypothetical protein